jgi:hypothetical protein
MLAKGTYHLHFQLVIMPPHQFFRNHPIHLGLLEGKKKTLLESA